MYKIIKRIFVLLTCFVWIISFSSMISKVNVKAQEILSGYYVDIGKQIFKFDNETCNQKGISFKDIIQYSKSSDKKTIIVKKSTSEDIVTNGKYLYYSNR